MTRNLEEARARAARTDRRSIKLRLAMYVVMLIGIVVYFVAGK